MEKVFDSVTKIKNPGALFDSDRSDDGKYHDSDVIESDNDSVPGVRGGGQKGKLEIKTNLFGGEEDEEEEIDSSLKQRRDGERGEGGGFVGQPKKSYSPVRFR